ncbi:hypothetical protein [Modicisalibacter coralii]|uniref:hypothetical protein n=1 Tax=Modicisalibacter coralii TaxID=2304602 RepID=UPI00100A6609|nr:hypothetical protein [Halomonas coralii]
MIEMLMGLGSGKPKRIILSDQSGNLYALDKRNGDILYSKYIGSGGVAGVVYDSSQSLIKTIDNDGKVKTVRVDDFSQVNSGPTFSSAYYNTGKKIGLSSGGQYAFFVGSGSYHLTLETSSNSGSQYNSVPYNYIVDGYYSSIYFVSYTGGGLFRRDLSNNQLSSFSNSDDFLDICVENGYLFALTLGGEILVRSAANVSTGNGSMAITAFPKKNNLLSYILASKDGQYVYAMYRSGNNLYLEKFSRQSLSVLSTITLVAMPANYPLSSTARIDSDGNLFIWINWTSYTGLKMFDSDLNLKWDVSAGDSGYSFLSGVHRFIGGDYE